MRLWRQPTGRLELAQGGFVEAAPVGAADLTGIVAPEGWRIEVEIKGERTPTTAAQVHWRQTMLASGAIALQVRYDGKLSLKENLRVGVETICAAIEERRRG